MSIQENHTEIIVSTRNATHFFIVPHSEFNHDQEVLYDCYMYNRIYKGCYVTSLTWDESGKLIGMTLEAVLLTKSQLFEIADNKHLHELSNNL